MKYAWIADHRHLYTAALLCRVLQVSRTGYQQWQGRPRSERAIANQAIGAHLKQLHHEYQHTYGRRRMRYALLAQGIQAGEQRIARLMRQHQLHAHVRRRWRPRGRAGLPCGLSNQLSQATISLNISLLP